LTGPAADALEPDASEATARALVAATAASAKSGHDVVVLDVGPIISIIECFVLASASNTRQVRTIVDEIELALKEHDGSRPINTEGRNDLSWVLLDYGDIVVHVFLDETRAYYDLDRLWADAPRIPFEAPRPVVAGD
jgi:ribosome-associated protein